MNNKIFNMTGDELIIELGKCYNTVMSEKKNEDYGVNRTQLKKLFDAVKFFEEAIKDGDGRIEELRLVPKEESGGFTASFAAMNLYDEAVSELFDVLKDATALSIDSTADGRVEISTTFPEVFKPIK